MLFKMYCELLVDRNIGAAATPGSRIMFVGEYVLYEF